ncbi:ATP-grasp domain-containing protein [Helicobacter pullorum]
MQYRVLIEASGSLTSFYLINAIKEAGNIVYASDIDNFNAAALLADHFVCMPKVNDSKLWEITEKIIAKNKINMVIPTLDESLLGWSQRRDYFKKKGVYVIISPEETIELCLDKWKTYKFFISIGIETPKTELYKNFGLIKPRNGRGGNGIELSDFNYNQNGQFTHITQEIVFGEEYTIDCFFDNKGKPTYIIPRKRLSIKEGKSIKGVVCKHQAIEKEIMKIAKEIKFFGPINFQVFETKDKDLFFIEINPRLGGGSSLAFAASENWITLVTNNLIEEKRIRPKPIQYGLKMARIYKDVFFE